MKKAMESGISTAVPFPALPRRVSRACERKAYATPTVAGCPSRPGFRSDIVFSTLHDKYAVFLTNAVPRQCPNCQRRADRYRILDERNRPYYEYRLAA